MIEENKTNKKDSLENGMALCIADSARNQSVK